MEEMEAAGRFTTGPWGAPLYCYESLGSTNDEAKRLARAGAPHGTAVTARRQTAGKGRLGRSFYSPADAGMYVSVVLRPQIPAELNRGTVSVNYISRRCGGCTCD